MHTRLDELGEFPVVRTSSSMDDYLDGLQKRVAEARRYRNTTEDERTQLCRRRQTANFAGNCE
jgi:hypothetical protein